MPQSYSVIIPIFNEADSLVELKNRIVAAFQKLDEIVRFEILFIDDGSTDATPDILRQLADEQSDDRQFHVRYLQFRRNSGKSLALMAGFTNVDSDIVITIDGDLQDQPEEIGVLIAKLAEGYDLVSGWRHQRHDQTSRKLGSRLFNFAVTRATGLVLQDLNCGFKAYRREVVEALCIYGDYHRYIPVQAHLEGFRVAEAPVSNGPRKYGVSKYRTFRYEGFFDLLSLLFIHKYGLRPLHFFGSAAAVFVLPSLALLGWFTYQQILYWCGFGDEYLVLNRPLLAMSLTAIMVGVIFLFTGFVCDFILHHQIRSRIASIIAARTKHNSKRRLS